MSRRFWLPTQKGTTLFPKTMQMPTRLRIRGVEPFTTLHYAIAARFSGQLKQFHSKAQQTYALSNNDIYKTRIQFPGGARATYTNVQGMEVLDLEVPDELIEQLRKEQPKRVPDWCVVDVVVPNTVENEMRFCAALITPDQGTPRESLYLTPPDLDLAFKGIEIDYEPYGYKDYSAGADAGVWPRPHPYIRYAQPGSGASVPLGNRVSSLLVDLRAFPPQGRVEFDIYAYVDDEQVKVGETIKYRNLGMYATPGDLTDPITTVAAGVEYYADVSAADARVAALVAQYSSPQLPYGFHYTDFFNGNEYDEFIDQRSVDAYWDRFHPGIPPGMNYAVIYKASANTLHYPYETIVEDVIDTVTFTRTADLVCAFYYGAPPAVQAKLATHNGGNYAMWVDQDGVIPSRRKFAETPISSGFVPAVEPDNKVFGQYLGRVTIDREYEAVSFTPTP